MEHNPYHSIDTVFTYLTSLIALSCPPICHAPNRYLQFLVLFQRSRSTCVSETGAWAYHANITALSIVSGWCKTREREKKKVLKYGADFQRTKFHMGLTKSECEWIRMMKLNLFRLGEANCPLSTSIFLLFGIPPPTTALTASRSLFGKIRQEVFCVQTVNIYLSQCRLWILRKASYCKSSLITTSYSILQYDCYHYYYGRTEQFYILNWIDQGDSVTKKKQTLEYARYGPM